MNNISAPSDTGRAGDAAPQKRRLLVIDNSYTLEMIPARGIMESVTCRDLDGFFDHVWSVHPFASLLTSESWSSKYGRADWHRINDRHTFIEGKWGRFGWLERLTPLNFLLSQISLFIQLYRLIRRERISVIRIGDPLFLGLIGLALARLCRVPLVLRVNGNNDKIREYTGSPLYPRLFRTAAMEKRVERFVFPRVDLVAAPNPDNIAFAVANGADPSSVAVFRYGNLIAKEHLQPPEERGPRFPVVEGLGLRKGGFLLSVGRLEPLKCPDDCVKILAEVRRAGFDVKLVFAGEGQLRDELVALATELNVVDEVVFAGNQDQSALAQLIPNAAVILSPLTGRSLTECAFGAAPVVAYDLDWQGELIETGVTGELIPFRQWENMAKSTIKFLANPDYAAEMGRAVRRRALDMLDPATLNEHERREYSKLIAVQPASRAS